jgi:hypothetical protein
MKLIDSSAWVEFLRKQGDPAVKQVVARLIQADAAAYTCPIRFELLSGVKAGEEADLEQAFASSAAEIHLGQTSDDFKSRLGTSQRPLYFFARAANPILHRGLRMVAKLAFPSLKRAQEHHVFAGPRPEARTRAVLRTAAT